MPTVRPFTELASAVIPSVALVVVAGAGCGDGCGQGSGANAAQASADPQPKASAPCQLVPASARPGPEGEVPVRAEVVVDGLEVPWGLAFLPGGDLLVTERPGRIRLIRDGELVADPVARPSTRGGGEGGLLGIALHPEFARNRLFYIYMTVEDGGEATNRVERWRLADDGQAATRERVILDRIPAARFHNGGRLRFGPDGMLYVGTGDAGQPQLSQRVGSLAGKILRVTPDGEIPPDNPFAGEATYVLGVRNTQGFDWRDGSTLLVTDHGPSGELGRHGADEVSVASAGTNLGWPSTYLCQDRQGMRRPSLVFEKAVPPGGAALYRGDRIAGWEGSLLVGTLGSRHLHRVVLEEESRAVAHHSVYFHGDPPEGFGRLREVVMGPDGHLYVTTSNCDGRGTCPSEMDKILRILPE